MHEMALAEGILAVVLDVAGKERVERVRVRVGAAQRVEPESLRFCFELASTESCAADAALEVEIVDGVDAKVDAVKVAGEWRVRPGAEAPGAT